MKSSGWSKKGVIRIDRQTLCHSLLVWFNTFCLSRGRFEILWGLVFNWLPCWEPQESRSVRDLVGEAALLKGSSHGSRTTSWLFLVGFLGLMLCICNQSHCPIYIMYNMTYITWLFLHFINSVISRVNEVINPRLIITSTCAGIIGTYHAIVTCAVSIYAGVSPRLRGEVLQQYTFRLSILFCFSGKWIRPPWTT